MQWFPNQGSKYWSKYTTCKSAKFNVIKLVSKKRFFFFIPRSPLEREVFKHRFNKCLLEVLIKKSLRIKNGQNNRFQNSDLFKSIKRFILCLLGVQIFHYQTFNHLTLNHDGVRVRNETLNHVRVR